MGQQPASFYRMTDVTTRQSLMGHSLINVVKGRGGGGSDTQVSTPESGTAVKKAI